MTKREQSERVAGAFQPRTRTLRPGEIVTPDANRVSLKLPSPAHGRGAGGEGSRHTAHLEVER
jgi:hypothetical protein